MKDGLAAEFAFCEAINQRDDFGPKLVSVTFQRELAQLTWSVLTTFFNQPDQKCQEAVGSGVLLIGLLQFGQRSFVALALERLIFISSCERRTPVP